MKYESYLEHHGILGQKWGVRRYQNDDGSLTAAGKARYGKSDLKARYDAAKSEKKSASKEYNRAFNYAYERSRIHFTKKGREADQKRWEDAYEKGQASRAADKKYAEIKKERRDAINKTYRDINNNTSIGKKIPSNKATRMKAAKYVVDNDMTYEEALKKSKDDAIRNTAIFMSVYGAYTIGKLYAVYH